MNRNIDDIDTGKPLEELRQLQEGARVEFAQRIHGSIQRRIAASEAVDFSLMSLLETFFSYLLIPLQWWDENNESKKDE